MASRRASQPTPLKLERSPVPLHAETIHPLFHLQRAAGNAAVTALIQRQTEDVVDAPPVPPAQTRSEVEARQRRVASVAATSCSKAWPESRRTQVEHGAVLYEQGGVIKSTGTRVGSKRSDDSVDLGVHEKNAGCPDGAMPVGYWHTHPLSHDPVTKAPREKRTGDAAFSDGDKAVAQDNQLAAFVQDQFGFHSLSVGAWYEPGTYTPWRPFPEDRIGRSH